MGVPGGLFTPSLFFGALVGGGLGELIQHLFPGIGAPPGAFALVGMAGILAGSTHAAVSAVLIIFEMTGDYGVILPLMVVGGHRGGRQPRARAGVPLHRRRCGAGA